MSLETCHSHNDSKETKVSSLGYVIEVRNDSAKVVREDNSIEWYYFFTKKDEPQITNGDFVRVYRRRYGDTHRHYARYALYFFSPKDIATSLVLLNLGWQVQKKALPESENAEDIFLRPPCLEVKKQLESGKP